MEKKDGMFRYADKVDKMLMLLGTLGSIGDGLQIPLMMFVLSGVINQYGNLNTKVSLAIVNKYSLRLLYVAIGVGLSAFIEGLCWARTADRQTSRMRIEYLRSVLRQEVGFFDSQEADSSKTFQIVSTISSDSGTIQVVMGEKIPDCIAYISSFFCCFIFAFTLSWKVTLAAIPFSLMFIIPGLGFGTMMMNVGMTMIGSYGVAGGIAEQAISSIRTVYSYVGENQTLVRFSNALQKTMELGIKQGFARGLMMGSMGMIYISWAFQAWLGSYLVSKKGESGGDVFVAGFNVIMGGLNILTALPNLTAITEAKAAATRITEMIDREPAIDPEDRKGKALSYVRGEIVFKNVYFSYPSRPESPILQGLDLRVPAGKTVGLVGGSGSGKSTIISLLERFYDPIEGDILLDGHNIKKIHLKWLRSQMGLVNQEPVLFATSIKENILFGKEGASMDDLVTAAKAANAHDFIVKLPLGYETHVGQYGVQLSGGQKQRIAIARALIRDPKILLLDEATSALDAQSERTVQDAIDQASVGRTTIVIAHRLSTIRMVNLIVVLRSGKVIESGTHDELMKMRGDQAGEYSKMVQLQHSAMVNEVSNYPNQFDNSSYYNMDAPESPFSGRSAEFRNPYTASIPGSPISARSGEFRSQVSAMSGEFRSQYKMNVPGSPLSARSGEFRNRFNMYVPGSPMTPMSRRLNSAKTLVVQPFSPALSMSAPYSVQYQASYESDDEDKVKKYSPSPSQWRLLKMNAPEWGRALCGCIGAIGSGAVQPLNAYCVGALISVYFDTDKKKIRSDARIYSFVFIGIGVLNFSTNLLQHYNFAVMGEKLTKRIREKLLEKLMTFEIGWFDEDENTSAAICARLSTEASMVRSLVGDRMSLLAQAIFGSIFAYALGFWLTWRLTLVMIAVQPLLIGSFYARSVLMKSLSEKTRKAQKEGSQLASEAVTNHRTISAFSSQKRILGLFKATLEGPRKESIKQSWFSGIGLFSSQFFAAANTALAYWYGGRLLAKNEISPERLFQAFLVLLFTAYTIAEAGSMTKDISRGSNAISSVFTILDRITEIDPTSSERNSSKKTSIRGRVELKNVFFAYPSRPNQMIFKGLSLKIAAGTSIALVGQSGSGKSTIIGLLERFYDPLKGFVLVDEKDIRDYNLRALRSQIALVSQEPTLFAATIRENIAYGKDDAMESEIRKAAMLANAHEFISGMKDGYETYCGERGAQLSGGQKQRIALARAILKNPSILLLDEATSALDSVSENLVQEALEKMMVGRTCVVVAHRLSTIQKSNSIAVIKDGIVAEQGRHSDLLSLGRGGAYYSLVKLQSGSSPNR